MRLLMFLMGLLCTNWVLADSTAATLIDAVVTGGECRVNPIPGIEEAYVKYIVIAMTFGTLGGLLMGDGVTAMIGALVGVLFGWAYADANVPGEVYNCKVVVEAQGQSHYLDTVSFHEWKRDQEVLLVKTVDGRTDLLPK